VVLEGLIVDISDLGVRPHHAGEQTLPPSLRPFSDAPPLFFIIDRDLRLADVNREVKSSASPEAAASVSHQDTSELIALNDFDFGDPMLDHTRLKVGRPILDAFHTETLRLHFGRVFEQLLSGAQSHFSTRISTGEVPYALQLMPLNRDGDRDSEAIGILGMVTSRKEYAALERQLMELRKAESLRSLASGVSHHVNNALQGILGHASLLQSHPDDPSTVQREAKAIADLVQRASELLRQLFLFDEGGGSRDSAVDLNLAVMTAMSSLDEFFRSPLQLEVSFGNPRPILAPPPVIQSLVKDMLHLASEYVLQTEASNSAPRGTDPGSALALKTAHCREAPAEVRGLRRGVCSQLLVEQITPRPHARNTLKGPEQSTLPPSNHPLRRIQALRAVSSSPQFRRAQQSATRLGGAITATLSPSATLSISLYLPATEAEQPNLFVVDESAHPEVLIVDDDQTVASTIEQLLKDFGYECVVAQSGSRALAVSHAFKHSLRLLLLDAIMPGEDSVALLRTMRETHPHLRIVGFTGAGGEISDTLRSAGAEQVLRKPIDPQLLRDTLRTLLRPPSAANT
jgi:CheY-like chemotaxis protein